MGNEIPTRLGDGRPKAHGTWDYFGEVDPAHGTVHGGYESFSVGVFQWWKKKTGLGTKRLPAIVRIVGPIAHPEVVYRKALSFIAKQESPVLPLGVGRRERERETTENEEQ